MFLMTLMLQVSCESTKQPAPTQAAPDQIEELQTKLSDSNRDLTALQTSLSEAREKIAALNGQIADLQGKVDHSDARIKELEATKTHLEDLLTQLQLLRLNGMFGSVNETSVSPRPVIIIPTSTITPVAASPVTASLPSPTPEPAGSEFRMTNGMLEGRSDRSQVRDTPLFAERETSTGTLRYYHRDFWYDKPGLFIELRGSPTTPYSARLFAQTVVDHELSNQPFDHLSFTEQDSGINNDFGAPALRNYLRNSQMLMESLVYNLDELTIKRLLDALADPKPIWSVIRPNSQSSAPQAMDQKTRHALLEMLQAFADLRTTPAH